MKLTSFFLAAFLILSAARTSAQNTVSGNVANPVTKEKLQGAFVTLKAGKKTAFKIVTDINGVFVFKNVAAGEYDVTVEYIGYSIFTAHINVVSNNNVTLDVPLIEKPATLNNVNVFSKIDAEKESSARTAEKNANNITNIISSQAMQRSPDVNAANVLQRMSGVTLQKNSGADEAYAMVRGLEPRYNNTLINGVKITSPDEKSRFVSLDVVPSDLLQKIEISKSLLPEMEGDAIGGTVNLVMKDAPDSMVFKATGSLGYSKILLDRKYSFFSTNDIQQKSLYEKYGAAYQVQPGDFSRSNLDFKEKTPMPTGIAGVTYGRRFLHNRLGLIIADNFQNQYYGANSILNTVVPDIYLKKPAISDVSERFFSTQQLNNGVTLHLDYDIDGHNKIIISNVFLYSYLAQARTSIDTAIKGGNGGRTVPGTGPVSTDYLSVTNRQFLENLKIEGKHILSKHLLFDWAGVFSTAAKKAPDRADISVNKKIDTIHTTNDINGPYNFSATPDYFDEISRIWQHNEDKDYNVLANLSYKTNWGKTFIDLKAGGLYRHKSRYNQQDEYDLKPTTNSNGVKQVFTNINEAQWVVYTPSGTYDYDVNNYHAFENITAGYGQAKISFPRVDIFGGVRTETTEQGFTIKTFYPDHVNGVTKNYTDVLPSIMVKYKLNNKTNIRASYFKSISRPNYYELVPYIIPSNTTANSERGNPDLKHSIADNFDLRYEFFPKDEEQLFAGVFYKKIQDPIEFGNVNGTTSMPVNLGNATVYGAELVYTKYFGSFGITGNYTYIYSKIYSHKSYTDPQAGTTNPDTLQGRPMQGQTDNTLNVSLLYKGRHNKFFAQLAYEYLGTTLSQVYYIYGYDYYQQPQSYLSLSAEYQANRRFNFFGKFNNLLNTPTYFKIDNLVVGKDTYKASFLVGLRYTY